MLDSAIPSAVFIVIVLSLIPHDIQYGPQAALIAEAFTPRLRYSGASLGYQLASVIAGGPAPLIATALFAAYHTGYAVAIYSAGDVTDPKRRVVALREAVAILANRISDAIAARG